MRAFSWTSGSKSSACCEERDGRKVVCVHCVQLALAVMQRREPQCLQVAICSIAGQKCRTLSICLRFCVDAPARAVCNWKCRISEHLSYTLSCVDRAIDEH